MISLKSVTLSIIVLLLFSGCDLRKEITVNDVSFSRKDFTQSL